MRLARASCWIYAVSALDPNTTTRTDKDHCPYSAHFSFQIGVDMGESQAPTLEGLSVGMSFPRPTICSFWVTDAYTDLETRQELITAIFEQIPDVKSLKSLVHASPTMHAVYIQARERIITRVTLNEMRGKNFDLTPTHLIEMRLSHKVGLPSLTRKWDVIRMTFQSLHDQMRDPNSSKSLCLEVDQCIALRRIQDMVGVYHTSGYHRNIRGTDWKAVWDVDIRTRKCPTLRKVPANRSCYWEQSYHRVYLGVSLSVKRALDQDVSQVYYAQRLRRDVEIQDPQWKR